MIVTLEEFVTQLEDLGVLPGETIKDFISRKSNPKDAEDLAIELVRQEKLTKFQAGQIYLGNAKSLVLGNYVLMERIGNGAMGQVFKARHRHMDRIVAIKQLPASMTKDMDAIVRFEREVKAIAKFCHPNIVSAYDADLSDGVHFLVMEFIEGSDLSALVKQEGPFAVEKALNYVLQTAKGMEAAHAEGIVHRDIKPANLLVDKNGVVKILDLGIARLSEDVNWSTPADLTATGMVLGTAEYMAPEQALDSKTADARADIYSLGCSLFYFLTGKSTYEGDTLMKKLVAHREQPIPSLQAIRGDIPELVESVFEKMVAKDVADRYQTMTDVISALEGCGRSLKLMLNLPLPFDSTIDVHGKRPTKPIDNASFSVTQIPVYTKKMNQPLRHKYNTTFFLIGAGILCLLVFLSALMVTLRTKDGTLVVSVNEPEADVQVLNEAGKVEITRTGESAPLTITIDPGNHRLKVSKQGFELFVKEFEIESGGKLQLTAKLIPLEEKQTVALTKPDSLMRPAPEVGIRKPLAFETSEFSAWVEVIAALSAEEQVVAVSQKLSELNPGFDGKLTDQSGNAAPRIMKGVVTELRFAADKVTDLSPVRALPKLNALSCFSISGKGLLSNLSPLKGMSFTSLNFAGTRVSDLSPLHEMKLTTLSCFATRISDLTPLRGMKLRGLNCAATYVSDLSPLLGMPLSQLVCFHTYVSDLSPLKAMPLSNLNISNTDVDDLSPLRGMPLNALRCDRTEVFDVSPLRETDVTSLILTPKKIIKGMDIIREMKTLSTIGVDGATPIQIGEFWKKYDAGDFGKPTPVKSITDLNDPAFQQWMNVVAALPPEQQVNAVSNKLVELNPEFDGTVTDFDGRRAPKIEHGMVTEIGLQVDKVTDISPVRALAGLRNLNCHASSNGDSILSDLSPIKGMNLLSLLIQSRNVRDLSPLTGMPLHLLNCQSCPIKDLSPLKEMPLRRLILSDTKVIDLSPLQGMKLNDLYLNRTRVKEISFLGGMPLRNLNIDTTQVSDLSPLQGMPLTSLFCRFTQVSDLSPLKGTPLSSLYCNGSHATDLSPLEGMELTDFYFSSEEIAHGIEAIRQMKTIVNIGIEATQTLPPDEFWKRYDTGELGKSMPQAPQ